LSFGSMTVDVSTVSARRRSRPRASRTTPKSARLLASLLGVVALSAASAPAANAANVLATATLLPGGLTVSSNAARVDPADPRLLDVSLEVIDARGNGAGWSVFLSAAPTARPSDGPAYASASAPSLACLAGVTCTLARSSVAYPLAIPLSGAPVKVLNALPDTGMGAQTATLPLLESSSAAPASLQTTVTVASGP